MKALLLNKNRIIYLSVAASLITLGLKFAAYYLTGSVGLLSDAAESLVNLAAAVVAASFLWYASRPPDRTHTYGHDKAEYFSSGVEGTLIIVAAIGICYSATVRLIHPVHLENLGVGLIVAVVASGVNFVVARRLLIASREHDSIVLEADAQHLMTDVWTSLGVVVGLAVVAATGLAILDPLIAYALAVNIVFSGVGLLKRSFRGLMDHALPAAEVETIERILKQHAERVKSHHNLRTRKAGPNRFIDFHVLVAGSTTVQAAHDLCEVIEAEIESVLANTQVNIHVEPVEDKTSWDDAPGLRK
ncbi:MAG TPA: cation diffusion facilitator family transporter [bacterium]